MTRRIFPGALLLTAALGACGGSAPPATQPEPLPTPPPAKDAGSAGASKAAACLAPWGAATGSAKVDPKPLDPDKLAEVEQAGGDPVEQAYARARIYFEAQHWVESAVGFRAIAFDHPDSDVGAYAVELYLECLNVLGSKASRPDCYEDMMRDVPTFLELYCTARRSKHDEECRTLDRIQQDILRLQAQSTFANGEQSGDKAAMHAGAEKYLALLRALCKPSQPPPDGARCDEIAYNAAVAFLASDDPAGADGVKAIMVDPKNGMNRSPLTAKLVCRLGGTCPP